MTEPTISAIVPCFNVGSLLLRTIDSLRAQTMPPVEILVVDDASTTPETVATLSEAERIPTVKVIRQPVNSGVAAARNLGLDRAIGDFAVFLDGDDMFTAPSLEAFLSALRSDPEASFAYPTVTCFGNRHDTFPAPEFNAYLLHHANICPIASMINRDAINSGVRFDPAIGVGHEDWDYWLRLVAAGHMGIGAPDAVLLYRRVGFTRNDLGNQIDGGFEAKLRELRPEIFDADRLMDLKREWAPGLSIVTSDPERAGRQMLGQTCRDAEVLDTADAAHARGRVVAFEWGENGTFLDDPFAVEDVLSMGSFIASDQILVALAPHAVRPGTPSGIPEASDLHRGWVESSDIAVIALPNRWASELTADGAFSESAIEELLLNLGLDHAHRILWRAPQQAKVTLAFARSLAAQSAAPPKRHHSPGWTRDVIRGLRPGAPWRTARANGLFGEVGPTAFRDLIWVEDPFGGFSLYGSDETQLIGSRTLRQGPRILRSSAAGTIALSRTEHRHTHRRAMTTGEPPAETMLQEVVGHIDPAPLPGTRLLTNDGLDAGVSNGSDGWVFTTIHDSDLNWPRSSSVLFGARVIWRGHSATSGCFSYDFNTRALCRESARADGRLLVLTMGPRRRGNARDLRFVLDGAQRVVGLTTAGHAPDGFHTGAPIGCLDVQWQPGHSPIYSAATADGRSFVCGTSEDEMRALGAGPATVIGFSPPC